MVEDYSIILSHFRVLRADSGSDLSNMARLLGRAKVVLFSRPGSGEIVFRSISVVAYTFSVLFPFFIVAVSWLMFCDPFAVQQATVGKRDPIDVVRSSPRPRSRGDDQY